MLISTRLHGVIDYAVSTLLGAMSMRGSLSAPVRRTLGIASLGHASYATQTDYEAGLAPRLTMRQHLALDAIGAAALVGTGLLLRRQPAAQRTLLVAIGLAELAAVGLSSATPSSGPGQGAGPMDRLLHDPALPDEDVGYPPFDTLKPVAEAVFIVDSQLGGTLGRVLPARMTVIKLPDGDLLLHSPTRFSLSLKAELEQHGRIRHLVAPNYAHWIFLQEWQRHCPDAVTWAAPGLRDRAPVRKSGLRLDADLGAVAPQDWGGVIELDCIPGGLGFREIAFFHVPTRTLILTDLVLNLEAWKLPTAIRPLVRLLGATAPVGMTPPHLRMIVRMGGAEARAAAARLVQKQPERVIFAHGAWFDALAAESLRRSLRWLL